MKIQALYFELLWTSKNTPVKRFPQLLFQPYCCCFAAMLKMQRAIN